MKYKLNIESEEWSFDNDNDWNEPRVINNTTGGEVCSMGDNWTVFREDGNDEIADKHLEEQTKRAKAICMLPQMIEAFKKSHELITNLISEGSLSEESIFAQECIKRNEQVIKKIS